MHPGIKALSQASALVRIIPAEAMLWRMETPPDFTSELVSSSSADLNANRICPDWPLLKILQGSWAYRSILPATAWL